VEGGGIGGSIQEAEVPYLTVWVLVHAVRYRTDELWVVKFEKFGQCRLPKRKKVKKKKKKLKSELGPLPCKVTHP
jgi:hypothetical protein